MRLRLRIVRDDLPEANTLWPIPATQQKNTIAQLLENIDQSIPLTIGNRGLEEYVVEVAGYECLHYYEISTICKDEDEVVIRPLTLAEVRARHITGRVQIDESGRKLHDGVAYGRPLLTAPVRPTVKLRKRKRNDADDGEDERRVTFDIQGDRVDGAPLGSHPTFVPFRDYDEEEDEDDDEDFEDDSDDDAATSTSSSSGTSDSSSETASSHPSDSPSDDSSDDSSSGGSSSDDSSSDDSSSDDPSSDDSSSEGSSKASAKLRPKPRDKQAEPKRSSNQNQNLNESQRGTTNTAQAGSLPHAGKLSTRSRNIRRRDSKKLAWLKSQNILPPNADLKAAREWQGEVPWSEIDSSTPKRGESMDTSSVTLNGGDGKETSEASLEADLAARRQLLLQSLASGGIELGPTGKAVQDEDTDMDEGPEVQSNKIAAEHAALTERLYQESIDNQAAKNATDRRRLDLSSAERLLYGSLGVRAPKTQEQKDAIQKKLAGRFGTAAPTVKSAKQPEQPIEEENDAVASDDWRSKINLRAVECVEENVQLCPPPFPFHQRWDPNYHGHSKKKNRNMAAYTEAPRKRRRRNQNTAPGAFVETYDKYNQDGTGDALDYDGDGGDDSYWEEGALLGDEDEYYEDDLAEKQLLDEANAEPPVDDFPLIPSDPSTLTALAANDARVGDYVVYTEMVCSPATNWQPQMLLRTVKLLEKEEGADEWKTQMALRDLPPKEYDEDGTRVYGKFEMAGMSDDEGDGEEDERVKVLAFGELSEVKLLKRGEQAAE